MVIIGAAIKGVTEYRIQTNTSIFSIDFAAIFLIVAILYNTIPLLMSTKTNPITWKGRKYVYTTKEKGFVT